MCIIPIVGFYLYGFGGGYKIIIVAYSLYISSITQQSGTLSLEFRKSKIIAIKKSGNSNDRTENYRPIALLSVCYKLLLLLHLLS